MGSMRTVAAERRAQRAATEPSARMAAWAEVVGFGLTALVFLLFPGPMESVASVVSPQYGTALVRLATIVFVCIWALFAGVFVWAMKSRGRRVD
jgi:cell division protein FtsX